MAIEKWKDRQDEINAAPKSHHMKSFLCVNCNHVHLVLFDEADKVIATATLSNEMIDGIIVLSEVAADRVTNPTGKLDS